MCAEDVGDLLLFVGVFFVTEFCFGEIAIKVEDLVPGLFAMMGDLREVGEINRLLLGVIFGDIIIGDAGDGEGGG